jgi:cell division transport system permease protein
MRNFLTKIKRVIKAGLINFWRNSLVSLATILVMVVALFTVGALIFSRAILTSILEQIQDKVDISVYFKSDARETDIFSLKDRLEKMNEVKNVEYVSVGQAMEEFKKRHKDNALIMQSLEELGENPLGAAFNIKAKETFQYESIAKFLEDSSNSFTEGPFIDKINFYQNKLVINRLSEILDSTKKLGFSLSIILIFISSLITFNTISLAIYTSREEIEVMRLVGASNKFISGPFVVEGIMYGIIASVISITLLYPFTAWLNSTTQNFLGGINIYEYYISNSLQIFLILFLTGVVLGAVSSFIAVRKYLT